MTYTSLKTYKSDIQDPTRGSKGTQRAEYELGPDALVTK